MSSVANHSPATSNSSTASEAVSSKKKFQKSNATASGNKSKSGNSNSTSGGNSGGSGGSKNKESADASGSSSGGIFKPFIVLGLPGVNLFRRFSQYRRLPQDPPKDKLEVELERLNNKIVS